jgi:hypothetical protein
MKQIETTVSYTVPAGMPEAGQVIQVPFVYPAYESVDEAKAAIGEVKLVAMINQTVKEDNGNVARESAKAKNGHSTRAPMTDEEKAQAKAKRQAEKSILDALKAKANAEGVSIEDLLAQLG